MPERSDFKGQPRLHSTTLVRMRVPTTGEQHEVNDLTTPTYSHPQSTRQQLQGDGTQHGATASASGTKRKYSHVDEEHRVIGRLKRVHLVEGACRGPDEVVVLDDVPAEERALDVREGLPVDDERGCAHGGAATAAAGAFVQGDEQGAQWYLDDVGPSLYQDVNRTLGLAHKEMVARRKYNQSDEMNK